MKNKRYELTNEKYLLDEEIEHLEETLHRYEVTNPRDTTLIWLSLYTGGRASEILNLTMKDLNLTARTVFINGLKGSDNREFPVPKWLFDKILALKATGRLFPISYMRFYQIWLMYRPVKKKLHSLRHTFAIRLYRRTKDLRLTQVALGHRYWGNTMIYAKYQYSSSEFRKAILGHST